VQTTLKLFFGDTAICINPNDERFAHLKGKKDCSYLRKSYSIIEDEYVDIEFGTGCLVTRRTI
jgi:valyl-tRNA synthetase